MARAVAMAVQAERLRERIAAPLPPTERGEYEACLALARQLLSDEVFAGALAGSKNATAP